MKWVVNGHSIKHDFILHGGATPNIKLSALVAGKNYSGHHLQVLRKICLAPNRGDLFDIFWCDFNY